MISKYELTMEQRDDIMGRLTEEQRHFLHHILVRGRRTRFARQLARMKFQFIPEEVTLEELEAIIDEWDYVNFIDSGTVSPHTRCECGRALRYQHEVLHVPTNTRKFFGIDHLQLHTGIDAQAVSAILNGFDVLDGEMNELLCKCRDGWQLHVHLHLPLPDGFELPGDIQEHIDMKLPLLDRQLLRLKNKLREFEKAQREAESPHPARTARQPLPEETSGRQMDSGPGTEFSPLPDEAEKHEAEYDLFSLFATNSTPYTVSDEGQGAFLFDFEPETAKQPEHTFAEPLGQSYSASSSAGPFHLSPQAEQIIKDALPIGRVSAKAVAEFLIERRLAPDKRFSTGKPDVYIAIAAYLDKLCREGHCLLTESSPEDRIYEKLA